MAKRLLVKKREQILSELTQEIPANGIITVGNDTSATVELQDEKIAPEQFVIVCEEGAMTLLCRVDGTAVNGKPLPQGALHNLQFGDEIKIDGYTLIPEADDVSKPLKKPVQITETELIEKADRSLSDVLENLRSEEKFYFLINETERVYVEAEEMRLGWTAAGECVISAAPDEVETPRAQIHKDWSGVVLSPLKKGDARLNDEILRESRRLKNDDKIYLLPKEGAKFDFETEIKFHEPTALLLLDSILPKELPPPVILDETNGERVSVEPDFDYDTGEIPSVREPTRPNGRIFGYFTRAEIIIMAIGTLITAAVIFLILEFY